jgi:Druantia protein DruA
VAAGERVVTKKITPVFHVRFSLTFHFSFCHTVAVATPWRYRGREISADEILFIRQLIREHPGLSRRRLSQKLCQAWRWKQANGALCDMVCRGLLLLLHRAGEIELPPVRYTPPNPLAKREPPAPVLIDKTPIRGSLSQLRPIEFQQVRRTPDEALFNSLMEHHHYLGYEQPVGEHLKYVVWSHGRRSRVLRGVQRHGTWAAATASSAGVRKRGDATFASWPTTPAF